MKKVRLGGRVLSVEDELVPRYLAQGYSVIGKDGAVIQEGDIVTLDAALNKIAQIELENRALKNRNSELEARNAELEAVLSELSEDNCGEQDTIPSADLRCPHCGKEYKTEKGLNAHIAKEHAAE